MEAVPSTVEREEMEEVTAGRNWTAEETAAPRPMGEPTAGAEEATEEPRRFPGHGY
jgi:hypothetical protein